MQQFKNAQTKKPPTYLIGKFPSVCLSTNSQSEIIRRDFHEPEANTHEGKNPATAMGTHFAIAYADTHSNTSLDCRRSSGEVFKSCITSSRRGISAMAASNHMPSVSISALINRCPRFVNPHKKSGAGKSKLAATPFPLAIKKPPHPGGGRLSGTSRARLFYLVIIVRPGFVRPKKNFPAVLYHLVNRPLSHTHDHGDFDLGPTFEKFD